MKRNMFHQKSINTICPKLLNFDRMLYSKDVFEASYSYERYVGRVKLKEAPADVTWKGLVDHESPVEIVFKKDKINRKMDVANTVEEQSA